jgi:hypothetical protein
MLSYFNKISTGTGNLPILLVLLGRRGGGVTRLHLSLSHETPSLVPAAARSLRRSTAAPYCCCCCWSVFRQNILLCISPLRDRTLSGWPGLDAREEAGDEEEEERAGLVRSPLPPPLLLGTRPPVRRRLWSGDSVRAIGEDVVATRRKVSGWRRRGWWFGSGEAVPKTRGLLRRPEAARPLWRRLSSGLDAESSEGLPPSLGGWRRRRLLLLLPLACRRFRRWIRPLSLPLSRRRSLCSKSSTFNNNQH